MVKTLYTLARGPTATGATTAGATQYWVVANGPLVARQKTSEKLHAEPQALTPNYTYE